MLGSSLQLLKTGVELGRALNTDSIQQTVEKALKDLKVWAESRGAGMLAKPVCACFGRLHNPGPLRGSVLIGLSQSLEA